MTSMTGIWTDQYGTDLLNQVVLPLTYFDCQDLKPRTILSTCTRSRGWQSPRSLWSRISELGLTQLSLCFTPRLLRSPMAMRRGSSVPLHAFICKNHYKDLIKANISDKIWLWMVKKKIRIAQFRRVRTRYGYTDMDGENPNNIIVVSR